MANEFFEECLICGQVIDSERAHSDRRWMAAFQAFQLRKVWDDKEWQFYTPEKGRLVRPAYPPSSAPLDCRIVHSLCWIIVAKVVGKKRFKQAWLNMFSKCLEALGPIVDNLETTHSPDCRGEDLYQSAPFFPIAPHYLDEVATDTIGYPGLYQTRDDVFRRFNIPPEIVQLIYSFLPTYEDIMNLQSVTTQGASAWVWLSLGRKFIAAHSSLAKTERLQLSGLVLNAIRNTELFPADYPRAVNYARIWDGVQDILYKMEKPPAGRKVGSQGFSSSTLACSLEPFTHTKEITVPPSISVLTIHFKEFNDGQFLCGFCFGSNHLGYTGDYSFKVEGGRLYGLHLAIMDGLIISVRARFGGGWSGWTPEPPTWGESQYLVIDPSERVRGIQATFNTFRLIHIRYTTPSHRQMIDPFPCQTYIPSSALLPAVCLVDRIPDNYEAINFIFTYDMARVTAISAYVVADSQAIHALELIYDNSPITIGQHNMHNDWTSVKLTFHLASEMNEVLSGIECAEAFQNSGVSIKFLTTLGRSVLFGDDAPEIWTYAPLKSGFFCVAPRYGFTISEHYPISRVGIFSGGESIGPVDNFVEPITWPTIDASCSHEKDTAFVSSASLKAVAWIIMYHHEGSGNLTGMQLIYESGPPMMLGKMEEECVSLAIREPITRIEIHIERRTCSFLFHITGITFFSQTRSTGAGSWDEDAEELEIDGIETVTLDVPENEIDPPLYWAFTRGQNCLSFSLDDFESDHPPGSGAIII